MVGRRLEIRAAKLDRFEASVSGFMLAEARSRRTD